MSQQASNAVCPMKHAHLSEKTKIANNVGLSKEIKHFHNVSVLKELFTKCLINNHFEKRIIDQRSCRSLTALTKIGLGNP